MHRIAASPEVLRWARERAGLSLADLQGKFPKLAEWEAGTGQPTMKQLEDFAKKTQTPFGFSFCRNRLKCPYPLRTSAGWRISGAKGSARS